VFVAPVQAALNALTLTFRTTNATRLTAISLGHFFDLDALDLRFVREYPGEAIERPPVQVEVPVFAPVPRLAVFGLSNAVERPGVDALKTLLDTPLDDVRC
jgi:hypothetical protein